MGNLDKNTTTLMDIKVGSLVYYCSETLHIRKYTKVIKISQRISSNRDEIWGHWSENKDLTSACKVEGYMPRERCFPCEINWKKMFED